MTYVITGTCCKDASCVPVCPVDCIRPAGDDALDDTEMLYIDPETCIDCGACVEECPVDAIRYEEDLAPSEARFKKLSAAYFDRHPLEPGAYATSAQHGPIDRGALRVAVVGTGPAACYATADLVAIEGVEVNLFDRLPTPFGLIRAGVAPDHQSTKAVQKIFEHVLANERVKCHFNVEVGRDLTHDDLMAHHHAVIYAVGASVGRKLGIPGENLPGHYAAADFVGWYNGHPDYADRAFDLSCERAVIIGNGNVALDVARLLVMTPQQLAQTDIADHALEALSNSDIREVVVLGRRGPRNAAFSVSQFMALGNLESVDVVVDGGDLTTNPDDDVETTHKLELAREYASREPTDTNKRIVFRFDTTPAALLGHDHVQALRVVRNHEEELATGLVLRSIGYRGAPMTGVRFDDSSGTIPNKDGRVVNEDGRAAEGIYVTGWIKRGARGVIGTNRSCAAETVAKLLEDFDSGLLERRINDYHALVALMSERGITPVDWQGWRSIDEAERRRGADAARPRLKFVAIEDMLATISAGLSSITKTS